ncbi:MULTISPECIES: hypothetical protein [Cellulophaga]|uniref:hypothetical protein n=1 Tax=Cellulophaga TaxID=104264 RepID=UPI0005A2767C|nr:MULTISPECIES: hypothetical protein [Cellulophaga]
MKKYISLILGIFAFVIVVYSFFGNITEGSQILGYPVDIWVYRLFWSVLTIALLFSYRKESKKDV